MEDVNKYLRKKGRKVGQKVEERAQKAADTYLLYFYNMLD